MQLSLLQIGSFQIRPAQIDSPQVGMVQVGTGQIEGLQIGSAEVYPLQACLCLQKGQDGAWRQCGHTILSLWCGGESRVPHSVLKPNGWPGGR